MAQQISVAVRETCRVVAGLPFPDAVPLWPWHRARLTAAGCDDDLLAVAEAAAAHEVAARRGPPTPRLRLTVTVHPDGTVAARLQRRLSSLDVPGGPTLAVVHVAAAPDLPHGPAKPADRGPWDEALRAARRLGARQAVLVGPYDAIIDGATANLWLVMRGTLVTPPAPPAVPGVARAWLLEHAKELGLPFEVRRVSPEELDLAEEIFLTNAFGGAAGVCDRSGAVVERVRTAFARLWGTGRE